MALHKRLLALLLAAVNLSGPPLAVGAFVRESYCNELAQLQNSSNSVVNAVNALKGRTVKVGVNLDADPALMYLPQGSYTPNNGLLFKLEQEIARRGGFKMEYVLVPSLGAYPSTDMFLNDVGNACDIYGAGVVTDTGDRRAAGIDFTVGVLDNSLVLVTTSAIGRSTDWWAFTYAFSPTLWGFIYLAVVLHAFFFWITEKKSFACSTPSAAAATPPSVDINGNESPQKMPDPNTNAPPADPTASAPPPPDPNANGPPVTLWFALYDSLLLTGEPEPTTAASGFLKIGGSLFIFVVIATYAANMGNIFITAQVPRIPVISIDDAQAQAAEICALVGSDDCFDCFPGTGSAFSYVNDTYPLVQLYRVKSQDPSDLMAFINNGTCVGAVMTMNEWRTVENFASANVQCNIVPKPDAPSSRFVTFVGAFATNMDYTMHCTSLVNRVWSAILTTMVEDGTYDKIYNDYITTQRFTTDCKAVRAARGAIALGIPDVAGVLVVLAVGMVTGVILAFLSPRLWGVDGIFGNVQAPVRMKRYLWRRQTRANSRMAGVTPATDAADPLNDAPADGR